MTMIGSRLNLPLLTRSLACTLVYLFLLCGLLGAGVARSQQLANPGGVTPTPPQLVADMLMRQAMQVLSEGGNSSTGGPRPDQIVRAEVLVELALEITPDVAEFWELRAELAAQAGDEVTRQKAWRRYSQLRPGEDAVRLDLILSELVEIETLDGRLALLENRLAELQPPQMTEALRSRLASSAASLAQELGNEATYLRHLRTAVRSDPANAEAAWMTYQLAVDRDAPPRSRGAAAMNVVRARPLDSAARLLLAEALAHVGVHDRAIEQFKIASQLPRDAPLEPSSLAVWSRCLIASGRTREAGELLDQIESYYSQLSDDAIPSGNPAGETGSSDQAEAALAEAGEMPTEFMLHRRVLLGEGEAGDKVLEQVLQQLQPRIDAGDSDAALDAAWLIAVFGGDTNQVTQLLRDQDQNDPRYQRASGFVFLQEGSTQWARNSFEAISNQDSVAAYGLALLQGRDEAGRARFLRDVNHRFPGSFGALLAARELQSMGREVLPGPDGTAIVSAMNRLPSTLWRYETERNPWVMVRARFEEPRSAFLRPITVQLSLSNSLDIPLPIDPEAGVDRRVMGSFAAYSGGRPMSQLPAMMMNLPHRLTLGPREQISIDARLDRSLFGLYLVKAAPSTLSYNTTFTFAPRFIANRGVVTGPLGSIDTVRSLQAFVPDYQPEQLQRWSERAGQSQGFEKFFALAMLSRVGENLTQIAGDRSISRDAVAAVNEAFEAGDTLTRGWVMSMLPPQTRMRSEFQTALDLAQRSEQPLVRIMFLMNQAGEAEAPAIAAAIRDGSPVVQRFAQALKDALSQPSIE